MDGLPIVPGQIGPSVQSGEHCEAVTNVVDHDNFPKWLTCFKDDYLDCLRGVHEGDTLKVVCVSHDGKITSVACARMISSISRHKVEEPIHMEQKTW